MNDETATKLPLPQKMGVVDILLGFIKSRKKLIYEVMKGEKTYTRAMFLIIAYTMAFEVYFEYLPTAKMGAVLGLIAVVFSPVFFLLVFKVSAYVHHLFFRVFRKQISPQKCYDAIILSSLPKMLMVPFFVLYALIGLVFRGEGPVFGAYSFFYILFSIFIFLWVFKLLVDCTRAHLDTGFWKTLGVFVGSYFAVAFSMGLLFTLLLQVNKGDVKANPENWTPWTVAKRCPELVLPLKQRFDSRRAPKHSD